MDRIRPDWIGRMSGDTLGMLRRVPAWQGRHGIARSGIVRAERYGRKGMERWGALGKAGKEAKGGERRRKDRLGRHGKEPGGNARLFCFVEFA